MNTKDEILESHFTKCFIKKMRTLQDEIKSRKMETESMNKILQVYIKENNDMESYVQNLSKELKAKLKDTEKEQKMY